MVAVAVLSLSGVIPLEYVLIAPIAFAFFIVLLQYSYKRLPLSTNGSA
jgi:hypothetical protein